MSTSHAPAQSYDETPYPALCHPYTHPGRLAVVAGLLGVAPAPPEACRVLELGCASGGNLVPMAFGLPDSTFVGVDVSPGQIAAADELAADLGARNVRFHVMDVMELTPELGVFDYVVAHGVYSWVPDEVKDRIMAICRQHLAPTGVAYVSYNVVPGWQPRAMLRELMLHHTRDIAEPRRRAAASRALIARLRAMIPDGSASPLARALDVFTEAHAGLFGGYEPWEDSALLHDELAPVNDPVSFRQFAAHAARHGLQHLGDARFPSPMDHGLSADALAELDDLAPDPVDREHYLDHFAQTAFRRSLLCHADVEVQRTVRPEALADACIAARTTALEPSVADPVTAAALSVLAEVSPRAVHMPELAAEACARAGMAAPDEATIARLAADLFALVAHGDERIELRAWDPVLTPLPSPRPLISPIARRQVQTAPVITNLLHESVRLDGFGRMLALRLDGRRTRADLLTELLAMLDTGRLTSTGPVDLPRDEIERQLAEDVDATLQRMARSGLLLA